MNAKEAKELMKAALEIKSKDVTIEDRIRSRASQGYGSLYFVQELDEQTIDDLLMLGYLISQPIVANGHVTPGYIDWDVAEEQSNDDTVQLS